MLALLTTFNLATSEPWGLPGVPGVDFLKWNHATFEKSAETWGLEWSSCEEGFEIGPENYALG